MTINDVDDGCRSMSVILYTQTELLSRLLFSERGPGVSEQIAQSSHECDDNKHEEDTQRGGETDHHDHDDDED